MEGSKFRRNDREDRQRRKRMGDIQMTLIGTENMRQKDIRKEMMQRTGREGGWLEDKMRRDDERKQSQPRKLWRRKSERRWS